MVDFEGKGKAPWIIELPQGGGGDSRVLDPITGEVVFVGAAIHCLAYIRSTKLPMVTTERAKAAVRAGVRTLISRLSNLMVAEGFAGKTEAELLLGEEILFYLQDESLIDSDEDEED